MMIFQWFIYLIERMLRNTKTIYKYIVVVFVFSAFVKALFNDIGASRALMFGAVLLSMLYIIVVTLAAVVGAAHDSYKTFVDSYDKPKRVRQPRDPYIYNDEYQSLQEDLDELYCLDRYEVQK